MKASPFREGMKDLIFLKYILLSMAVSLLFSSNEGFMGLVEKHPVYSKPLILFLYEGSLVNFKISGS
jgi:hypothetical protein